MKKAMIIAGILIGVAGGFVVADKPVGLSPAAATDWKDEGVVYGAGPEKAYYPSVLYDRQGFGDPNRGKYRMWYSDGSGTVKVVNSRNGESWSAPTTNGGLGGDSHHVQVLYDQNCFGAANCSTSSVKYKIWYWDIEMLYDIAAIAYAESADGVTWSNDQAVTQDSTKKLVTGVWPDWNYGSYGPVDVIYQPSAANTGDNPWNYSYVMFYDGTNGTSEETGLAYSANGRHWTAFLGNPVLRKNPLGRTWDSDDAVYGTVLRDVNGFHFWYSGGSCVIDSSLCPAHEGIGYAFSLDGLTWTKAPRPIFHITDVGAYYRSERTYTPAVVDAGGGRLRMYYSAKGAGDYAIGLAELRDRGVADSSH